MGCFRILVVCIATLSYWNQAVAAEVIQCAGVYQDQGDHTICSQDSADVVESGVSEDDKVIIVNLHNWLRSKVEPEAADMTKIAWDSNLAAVAQKLANKCIMKHDAYDQRRIKEYGMAIGQNLAAGHADWSTAINAWYNEIQHFTYGAPATGVTGHFAQMMFGHVDRIGCGFANCPGTKYTRYYACNYAPGITGQGSDIRPYKSGGRCKECPNSCRDGLCDCDGLLCRNGGVLNVDTCECKCTALFSGRSCEEKTCPDNDKHYCGTDWPPTHCQDFDKNFMDAECPYMCGACQRNGCKWKWCLNGGKLNLDTCSCECTSLYEGETCETKRPCPDEDTALVCKQFDQSMCSGEYEDYMRKTCPVKCNAC